MTATATAISSTGPTAATTAKAAPRERDRWAPTRRGAVYCSPACGGGCLYTAFEAATRQAAHTAKRLGGAWAPSVWENLGWHWAVTLTGPTRKPRYATGPNAEEYRLSRHQDGSWMLLYGPWHVDAATPQKAILLMVALLKSESKRCAAEAHLLITGAP